MADTGRNAWKWEKYKNVYFVRLWCYLYVYKSTIFWVAQARFRNKKGVKKFREVLKKFVRFEDNMKSEASFAKDERVSDSIPSGRWMWFLYKCYLKNIVDENFFNSYCYMTFGISMFHFDSLGIDWEAKINILFIFASPRVKSKPAM